MSQSLKARHRLVGAFCSFTGYITTVIQQVLRKREVTKWLNVILLKMFYKIFTKT